MSVRGHPCLVPDLREKVFKFSLLIMLALSLPYMVFIMLRSFYTQYIGGFIRTGCYLVKCYSDFVIRNLKKIDSKPHYNLGSIY